MSHVAPVLERKLGRLYLVVRRTSRTGAAVRGRREADGSVWLEVRARGYVLGLYR